MDGQGMSIFQGAASIHINNSAQDRLEEQEELEDQKRRNEELQHKLQNAFDDLVDDDEGSSLNSSTNFVSMNATRPPMNHDINSNGDDQSRQRNLPTYVESLNHLKGGQFESQTPSHNSTPRSNHNTQGAPRYAEEPSKYHYNPSGAGDGHDGFYQSDYRGHQFNHHNGGGALDPRQDLMNYEQLKIMYEMRVKECQQLAGQLDTLQTRADTETDSLRARLAAACSDRDKAELTLQQAQHLLASSKHSMVELEQQVTNVSEKLASSEQEKEQLKLELRAATVSLQDSQQRLHTLQVTRSHDTDALFREQQDRHREELDRLQGDLEKARSRIVEKENEIKILERRCLDRERAKEELLIEKGVTINRLAGELESAQNRLASGEAARAKERAAQLASERNAARDQVKELGSKLELTAHELMMCRNKLTAVQREFDEWRGALQQIVQEALPDSAYLGNPPSPVKLSTLKDMLSRYKQQIQKINSLQEEITKRDKKLEVWRKQDVELKSKLEEQRGVEMQLNSRLAVLQNKLDVLGGAEAELSGYRQQNQLLEEQLEGLRAELKGTELKYAELEIQYDKLRSDRSCRKSLEREANADLMRELERNSSQLKDTLRENGELKALYLQVCSARDAVTRELQDTKLKLASVQKERESTVSREKEYTDRLEKEKQQVEKLSRELVSEREELERANARISELQKEFTDKQREFTDRLNKYIEDERNAVRKEREPCAQCERMMKTIKNLEEQIQQFNLKMESQESNEALMQELRNKAEFFQKYILERFQRLQEQRHVATNTDGALLEVEKDIPTEQESTSKIVLDSNQEETLTTRTDMMMKEKQIRDQIAEKFTLEIKTIEMNCTKRIKELGNQHTSMVGKLKQLLETKAQEVDALKKFVVSERSKITELIQSKEKEMAIILRENQSLQDDYQSLREKTGELKAMLDKTQMKVTKLKAELLSEKEKSSKALNELTQQLKALDAKMVQVETQHELLKEKYRSVKKTALVYKEYASKKDAHVEGELERIRAHYEGVVAQMQEKLQEVVKKRREHEVNARINKMQSDFDAMISEANNVT